MGAAFALMLGGVGTTALTSSGAANADAPCINHSNYGAIPGQSVWGSGAVVCLGYQIGIPVQVFQDGTQVASGRGLATYICQGTTVRHYGISYNYGQTMLYSFDAACG
ncbi:hypothetical protein GCM10009839_32830 [Catenulispora yoronensis]|uniref:Uncharacterized protein n=1 Tax=Catenulispora yoronensis TaxID=450799 RepID=A0ABN2U7J3_9ACTN